MNRREQFRRTIAALAVLGSAVLVAVVALRSSSPLVVPGAVNPSDETHAAAPTFAGRFRDVAPEIGLTFVHDNGATGAYYFPEIMGAGCGLLDYDGDGDLDVYLVQGGPIGAARAVGGGSVGDPAGSAVTARPVNRLFRNDLGSSDGLRRLRFTDVTDVAGVGDASYGMGCATGDYDNDGRVDLFVTNFGVSRLYHNNGDGTFDDASAALGAPLEGWASSAAFVDIDNDGDLDLFVGFYVEYDPASNWPCKTVTGEPDYCGPNTYTAAQSRLFRNDGDRFVDVTEAAGLAGARRHTLGVACADLNGDRYADLFVANDGDGNQLWINQGDGTFVDMALGAGAAYNDIGQAEAGMGVAVGDADNDGDDDVFVSHLVGERNTLYTAVRPGIFEDRTARTGLSAPSLAMTGFGAGLFDFDHDGRLDVFVTNGAVTKQLDAGKGRAPFDQTDQLFRNAGGGRFVDVSASAGAAFESAAVGRGAAFGDIDNDGDVDIVTTYNGGAVRLLLNDLATHHAWLAVRVVGKGSNRDGIGAVVTVVLADGTRLRRHIRRDGSYLSANDVRAHFGLGDVDSVSHVVVAWPGGGRERFAIEGVNRQVELVEGTGAPEDAATPSSDSAATRRPARRVATVLGTPGAFP